MATEVWNSHQWSSPKGRRVQIEPGKELLQHHCSRCRRDFVLDPATGERYAVFVSVFRFRKLPDSITRQWLSELCPGAPLPYDIEVRTRLVESHAK